MKSTFVNVVSIFIRSNHLIDSANPSLAHIWRIVSYLNLLVILVFLKNKNLLLSKAKTIQK